MCGINGIVGGIKDIKPLLEAMNLSIQHRGPDFSGISISKSATAGFGHNLLTIRGKAENTGQPITFGHVTVMLNGEIYNYRKLRERYEPQHSFLTESDAEILAYLYLDKGELCVNELEGEFSIAIWDENAKKLIIATDPIGIKQLYYSWQNPGLIFSSEIRAILATGLVKKEFNPDVLFHALTLGCPLGDGTAYQGIHKLAAGQILVLEGDQPKVKGYFSPLKLGSSSGLNTSQKLLSAIDAALDNSVLQRSVGECKIGLSLSGGVDSSLIASYLVKQRPDAEAIFLRLDGLEENKEEISYSHSAAEKIGITSTETGIGISSRREFTRAILEISEDLVFHPVIFSEYLIFQKANERNIKVMLTGDGADELFLGYEFFSSLIDIVKSGDSLKEFLNHDDLYLAAEDLGGIFNTYLRESSYFFSNHFYFDDSLKGHLLSERYRSRFRESTEQLISKKLHEYDLFDDLTRFTVGELIFKFPQTLSILDKFASHFAVEARVPYLDKDIIRLALSIKQEQKVSGKMTKIPLRNLAEKRLSKDIAYRKKIGMGFPINSLFPDKSRLYAAILDSTLAKEGIFNMNYIKFRQELDLQRSEMNHLDAYLIFLFLWHDYHFGEGRLLELIG
jgi:asparagine synthase (glutamine-hydrolysing)